MYERSTREMFLLGAAGSSYTTIPKEREFLISLKPKEDTFCVMCPYLKHTCSRHALHGVSISTIQLIDGQLAAPTAVQRAFPQTAQFP